MGSMNSEQENTLNQILTCMDGLDTSNNGVIVMAATNRSVGVVAWFVGLQFSDITWIELP